VGEPFPPAAGGGDVGEHRPVLVGGDPHRVEGADVLGEAVHDRFPLLLERAEQRSHTIRIPPWLRSRYRWLLPWCTRWCDGVLSTRLERPERRITSVWIQYW
jgi:hypothetical protein